MNYRDGRHDNIHGDEHLTEAEPVSRNRAIEHCEMLLNDIRINWDYCKQKRDFVPDEDDIDLIEALHAEMEYYLQKHYKATEETLKSVKATEETLKSVKG